MKLKKNNGTIYYFTMYNSDFYEIIIISVAVGFVPITCIYYIRINTR